MIAVVEPKLPDAMGVWSEYGEVWLPRALYPRRWDAIKFALDHWGADHFLDVRCLSRWMRYAPNEAPPNEADYPVDYWIECGKDAPGAFRVWRLEQA